MSWQQSSASLVVWMLPSGKAASEDRFHLYFILRKPKAGPSVQHSFLQSLLSPLSPAFCIAPLSQAEPKRSFLGVSFLLPMGFHPFFVPCRSYNPFTM